MLYLLQMLKEFCLITGAVESKISSNWANMQKQVLLYAKDEPRKSVQKLLKRYNEYKEEENESNCYL